MAYVLTLIAVLVTFLWATPAHVYVADRAKAVIASAETLMHSDSASLEIRLRSTVGSVRSKTMELLRKELHRSVDGLVQ